MRITGLGWSCMQYKVSPSYFMYKLRQPVLMVNGGKDLRVFDVQQPNYRLQQVPQRTKETPNREITLVQRRVYLWTRNAYEWKNT